MLLEVKNLSKSYPSPIQDQTLDILDNINFTLDSGQTMAVTGPSGSGKSTLLNIIGTLDSADSGSIILNKNELTTLKDKELAIVRNREIGFVFQLHHLLPQFTVLENILLPTLAGKSNLQQNELLNRARFMLDKVGLSNRIDHRPGQLSGGECQRVAVVRALINKPLILLADEPTGSLDQQNALELTQLLIDLNKQENIALVFVTHSNDLAVKMDRVFKLQNGNFQD